MIQDAIVLSVCMLVVFGVWSLALGLALRAYERHLRQEFEETLRAFVSSPDDKTPSPLAVLMDQAATLLAARLAQQLKAMLAGTESGLSKAETQAVEADFLERLPPWAAILATVLPKRLKNQLLRNPQMVGSLAKMVGVNHGSERPAQAAFDFEREENGRNGENER